MRFVILVLLWFLVWPADGLAQDSTDPIDTVPDVAYEAGVRVGVVTHSDGPWPTVAGSLGWRLRDRFVFDGTYSATSRPVTLCGDFGDDAPPECDDRKLIHALTVGFRAELGSARLRPYLGVFLGSTWYNERGGIMGARAGLRYPLSELVSIMLDGAVQVVGDGGSMGGTTGLTVGAALRL